MSVAADDARRIPAPPLAGEQALVGGLALLVVYHLVLAVWMAAAPRSFFENVGPFGAYNGHYVRDTATFEAALAFGFAVAVRRASWRLPLLAVTTLQFALHGVNHLVDVDGAHPAWVGWFDFLSLAVATVLLGGLLALSRKAPSSPSQGAMP